MLINFKDIWLEEILTINEMFEYYETLYNIRDNNITHRINELNILR